MYKNREFLLSRKKYSQFFLAPFVKQKINQGLLKNFYFPLSVGEIHS